MSRPQSVANVLTRSTVRLLTGTDAATLRQVGTGFFYKVVHPANGIAKILILTNKHVVAGASVVQFVVSSSPSNSDLDEYGQPIGRTDQTFTFSLTGQLYDHPDASTDLCAIDVTVPVGSVLQSGRQVRIAILDSSWLVPRAERRLVSDVEPTLVIGYPSGEWDDFNNMPIARQGMTATNPFALYKGGKNFLVDVAAFGGSSGSPVFLYETPMYRDSESSSAPGTKAQLLGVLWGVLERTTDGTLRQVQVPATTSVIVPSMQTSLNLAIALHAEELRDIEDLLFPGINSATRSNA